MISKHLQLPIRIQRWQLNQCYDLILTQQLRPKIREFSSQRDLAWRKIIISHENILRPVELGLLCQSAMIPIGVVNVWYKKPCWLCSFAEARPWHSFSHGVADILGINCKIPLWYLIIVEIIFFFSSCLGETEK